MMNRPQAGSYEKPLFVSAWKAHWNTPVKNGKTLPDPIPDKISARRPQRGEARAHKPAGKSHWRARSVLVMSAEAGHPLSRNDAVEPESPLNLQN